MLNNSNGNISVIGVPIDGLDYLDSYKAEATAILGGLLLADTAIVTTNQVTGMIWSGSESALNKIETMTEISQTQKEATEKDFLIFNQIKQVLERIKSKVNTGCIK